MKVMTKPKIAALIFGVVLVLLLGAVGESKSLRPLWAAAGQNRPDASNAGAKAGKETLPALKEKLWQATEAKERNQVIASFQSLPGPDAEAAQVLLDYLREKERTDAWNIRDALVKLMTAEQVAQLAEDLTAYGEANAARYLVPVLAERLTDARTLTAAVLSLQELRGSFYQLVKAAGQRIFPAPGDLTRWLTDVHARLTAPAAKEDLVLAVLNMAREEPPGARRSALLTWLWEAQEKEQDAAARSRQLFNLYKLGEEKALAAVDELYHRLASEKEKAHLIQEAGNAARWELKGAARDAVVQWLWKTAETDTAPFSRQECLYTLYELGEKEALDKLVKDIDKNGMAALPGEDGDAGFSRPDWQFLKEAAGKYPQSYLARGIKAYEEVRSEPYFELARREKYQKDWGVYSYGDEQYDPEREIPGWEKFLQEFSRHPAADDAAYRLARCYEIEGRWAEALNMLQKARTLPDGDMRYHASGRLVYLLDVRMTDEQLKELPVSALDPALPPMVSYSLAVKQIRRDDYRQAAGALEEIVGKYKEAGKLSSRDLLPLSYLPAASPYDFWGSVEKQLTQVKKLAALKEQWEKTQDPARLYDLAAAIYHDQFLYYNHLWAGQRQWYNWLGYINATASGRAPAEMAAFAREMIIYNHSLPFFQQVYSHPAASPELKARALYSLGLCYIGLDQWGQDAWFVFTPSEVRQKIISTYRQFVNEYPESSMADDALLVLGAYTGDAGYLEKIIREYPRGDAAEKAQKLLEEMKLPLYVNIRPYGSAVPYKVLASGDAGDLGRELETTAPVPEEVKKWAAANSRQPFAGSFTSGQWRYIFIAAGEKPTAGYRVEITGIHDDGRGKLTVHYRVAGPPPGSVVAQVITHPCVLARIPAGGAAPEFREEG
ncbi:MAG: protease complex subunit PrcB family protein [Thermoanaerobacter sp.]|nr:protease complex subunit PrcB family protein [Thermoanaerobacter sp.]